MAVVCRVKIWRWRHVKKSVSAVACFTFGLVMAGQMVLAKEDSCFPENSCYGRSPFADLFENDLGIYGYNVSTAKMMYLDEESMTWYPLCGRPECEHIVDYNLEQSECNAYVDYTVNCGLVWWNDRVYYAGFDKLEPGIILYSMKADGTDHKEEMEYKADSGASLYAYLHRGKMYVTLSYSGEKNSQILGYDFDDPEAEPITVWDEENTANVIGIVDDYFILNCTPCQGHFEIV